MTTTDKPRLYWKSERPTALGRLWELISAVDPWGSYYNAAPSVTWYDPPPDAPAWMRQARALNYSKAPEQWHMKFARKWLGVLGATPAEVVLSGRAVVLEIFLHELAHHVEYWGGRGDVHPERDYTAWNLAIHRAGFRRTKMLFCGRAVAAGLVGTLAQARVNEPEVLPPTVEDSGPLSAQALPMPGLWPDAPAVFDGLSGRAVFLLGDAYGDGFSPAPEGFEPAPGTVYSWPFGCSVGWRVRFVGEGEALCERVPGGNLLGLPTYALAAMERRP